MHEFERDYYEVGERDGTKVVRWSCTTHDAEDKVIFDWLDLTLIPVADMVASDDLSLMLGSILSDTTLWGYEYEYEDADAEFAYVTEGRERLSLSDVALDTPCGSYWCMLDDYWKR